MRVGLLRGRAVVFKLHALPGGTKMRTALLVGAISLIGATMTGCLSHDQRATTISALQADTAKWQDDIKRRDGAAYAARYAPAGTLYDAGQPPVPGQVAMKAMMESAFKGDFAITLSPETFDASDDGSMGYVQGRFAQSYSETPGGKRVTERGYYLTVYRRQAGGTLKVVEDIGSPSPGA